MNRIVFALSLLAGCASDPLDAARLAGPAHPESPSTLGEALVASDAAFHGSVVAIDYRMSEPDSAGASVPYTFVTWRVEHAFRGVEAGGRYTIRCLGGPDGRGRALVVSTLPLFQVGDEDVIFARTDTTDACPLVGALYGRLRVEEGRVYDTFGSSLALGDEDRLTRVGWRWFPAANHVDIGGVAVDRTPSSREPLGEEGVELSTLVLALDDAAAALDAAPLAPSADPSLPIQFQAARRYE